MTLKQILAILAIGSAVFIASYYCSAFLIEAIHTVQRFDFGV